MTTVLLFAALSIWRMGGDITVANAPNGGTLRTMGGDIVVQQAEGNLVAKTMGGNIDIISLRGSAQAGTMGGEVRVNVDANGPGHNIDLSSLGGDIELTLPANFDGKFDVSLEESDSGDRHQITSDFPLHVSDSMRYHLFESNRLVHTATGQSGSAVNRVHISTVGGNITIHKK